MKALKTKTKEVFKTTSPEALMEKIKEMGLRNPERPYFFSHVRMSDANGNYYVLSEHIVLTDGSEIIVSPEVTYRLVTQR